MSRPTINIAYDPSCHTADKFLMCESCDLVTRKVYLTKWKAGCCSCCRDPDTECYADADIQDAMGLYRAVINEIFFSNGCDSAGEAGNTLTNKRISEMFKTHGWRISAIGGEGKLIPFSEVKNG